jgi:hypothetical protein
MMLCKLHGPNIGQAIKSLPLETLESGRSGSGARNRSEGHQNNHGLKNGAVLVIEKPTRCTISVRSDESDSAASDS